MVMKSLKMINAKLQFLHRQNEFLNPKLHRWRCNSLIQSHFDYSFVSWHSLVGKKIGKKIQVTQNKYIQFCLKLNSRYHIGAKEFQEINWLSTKEKVEQCVAANLFKILEGDFIILYKWTICSLQKYIYITRSHMALEIQLRKSNLVKRALHLWDRLFGINWLMTWTF